MAFNNTARSSRTTYFTVSNGKVRVRLKEAADGSVARQNKNGDVVHEFVYDEFTGRIVSVATDEAPFGKQWKMVFLDNDDHYTLSMPYDSSTAQKLLNLLLAPELDLTQPITLRPYDFTNDKGNRVVGVTVVQNGAKAKAAFGTAAYPIDGRPEMPELEKIKFKGQEVYDSTKRLEFIVAAVESTLTPKLSNTTTVTVDTVQPDDGGDDGLPF